ncbi:hypothetical protein [Dactylosporangium darangshiense]|uniref:hypothetical protein n=1 Tax=Dactylosporangium darangshiense TaxID=579108 RepID=UPI00362F19AE
MSSSEKQPGRIRLSAAQPGVEFVVRDGSLTTLAAATQRLDLTVEPGLYQIERRAGEATVTDVVLVLPGGAHDEDDVRLPLPAVAPVSASRDAPPRFRETAEAASAALTTSAAALHVTAGLVVVTWRSGPGRGFEVLDDRLRRLQGVVVSEGFLATWSALLQPGGYVLRTPANADVSLYLVAGWQTVVFHREGAGMSVHMTPMDVPWRADAPAHTATEAALAGLRQGRPVFRHDVAGEWLGAPDAIDPMVGILAAHALRIAGEADTRYGDIVQRLQELLPGHPDVTALAMLRGGRIDPRELSVSWPPTLLASYRDLILPADLVSPSAIADGSMAERIAGRTVRYGPWLAWSDAPGPLRSPVLALAAGDLEVRGLDRTARGIGGPRADPAAYRQVTEFLAQVAGFEGTDVADVRSRWSTADIARATELPVRAVTAALKLPSYDPSMAGDEAPAIDLTTWSKKVE